MQGVSAFSGDEVAISKGQTSAVITELGATLRSFRDGPRPVLWEFAHDEVNWACRGQVLAPWPNRLEDGSYEREGRKAKVPLDEPERHNAIHGLVRWLPWTPAKVAENRVVMSCVLRAQPSYPFTIGLELTYEVSPGGLEVVCNVVNLGSLRAPFGLGFHPYLLAGDDGIERARVQIPAGRRLLLDDRGLPVGEEPVTGTHFALDGRPLAGRVLDDCYTDLRLEGDGRWHGAVDFGSGRTEIWADAVFGYAMVYSGDTLEETQRRRAVAIEPMTCPPNALRSGRDLIELAPSEQWKAAWGIRASFVAG